MKIKTVIFLILISSIFSCNTIENPANHYISKTEIKKLIKKDKYNWQHKDIFKDSIPGISLEKAYKTILPKLKGDTIIVAILDTGIDISHKEFKGVFWKNRDEIPNNAIDDDQNGYVDDIHGWNFLGNDKGENVFISNYESTRFLRLYDTVFKNKDINSFTGRDKLLYKQYQHVVKNHNSKLEKAKKALDEYSRAYDEYEKMINALNKYFPNEKFTLEKLNLIKTDNDTLKYYIEEAKKCVTYKIDRDWFEYKKKKVTVRYEKHLGVSGYNESDIIGDNPNTLKDKGYGNNDIKGEKLTHYHSTQVTGVLAGNRNDDEGVKGITNLVKIMPIRLAALGSERDKDIALAIRYAVDNGAKVINMSFRNDFSTRREWVDEAIKYASEKDVLLLIAAGNESKNSDIYFNYPNDQIENDNDFANNFIVVGASTHKKNLISSFSNYGKHNVDIFAPGEDIYTSNPENEYAFIDGTSLATPIVSGVAALIRSYYPNLTAAEVKQIIMESGVSFDIMVNKPSSSKEKELVPFSSLSKSGKIVNAYNALLMAEEVSKKKKKK
ncbi:S8 family serine peptidase [Kordia zhangzhouensis]|uniref:S8 family serine peptidase n=1 Tax=Kordia zhangzhouensis TaxID=1620405 RepID=UPI0006294C13|nr:S8 family serine peptidase [Kordia zhangzhouensis]